MTKNVSAGSLLGCLLSPSALLYPFTVGLFLFCCVKGAPLYGVTISVSNTSNAGVGSLRQALATAVNSDTISLDVSGTINITSNLPVITQNNLTIVPSGINTITINGGIVFRGLVIGNGTITPSGVSISGLSIQNSLARGGNGANGSSSGGAGGGGAGLGGGVFVKGTDITFSSLTLSSCRAQGGSGGNGTGASTIFPGAGGAGGSFCSTSSINGSTATGSGAGALSGVGGGDSPGTAVGTGAAGINGGFDSGASGGGRLGGVGGMGGFGGGGGGGGGDSGGTAAGGAGGTFGGGGGGAGTGAGLGGAGGLLAGAGQNGVVGPGRGGSGGGGAGVGAIFYVSQSSSLILNGITVSGSNLAIGGTPGAGALPGIGFATGVFLDTSATLRMLGTMTANFPIDTDASLTDGGVTVSGGTVSITQANSYKGGTSFTGGVAQITADNNLGNSSGTLTFNGGTLETTGSFTSNRTTTLSAGGGTVLTNAGTWILSGVVGSVGALTKTGVGTLSLTNTNSYQGGTTFNNGIVSITADANLGNAAGVLIFNGGTVATSGTFSSNRATTLSVGGGFVQTDSGTWTLLGAISNVGALAKLGSGTLALQNNTNSYQGGTTISAGTLQTNVANTIPSTGTVAVNTSSTLNLQGFNQSIGDYQGAGATTLGSAILTTTGTITTTYSGNISGTGGSLIKAGGNTLILTGTNSYNAGTTINAGILQGTTNGIQGNITNNASLIFDQNFDGVYSSIITGGSVSKTGSGKVNFTGTSVIHDYTGIQGGTAINGQITVTIPMQIDSGATLSGAGTITGSVNVDGTISPGNSIDSLTISQDLSLSSTSVTVIEFGPASPSSADLILTGGQLTIDPGATLSIMPELGVYTFPLSRTIINASSFNTSYQFTNVITSLPLVNASVIYDLVQSDVLLILNFFINVLPGGNIGQVAKCLDQFTQRPCGNMGHIVNIIASIPTMQEAEDAFNQMQPSLFTSLSVAQENNLFYFRDALYARLYNERNPCPSSLNRRVSLWSSTFGGYTTQENEGREPGYTSFSPGAIVGADTLLGEHGIFGGSVGYIYSDFKWKDSRGDAHIQNAYGNFYGAYSVSWGYIQSGLTFGAGIYHTQRSLVFGPFNAIDRNTNGSFVGWEGAASLGTGLIYSPENFQFSPFANLDYMVIYEPDFKEHGASELDLHIRRHYADLLTAEGGLDFNYCQEKVGYFPTLFARLSAIRETRFYGSGEKGSFSCPCLMQVEGYYPSRWLFGVGFGFNASFGMNDLTFSFRGKYGDNFSDNLIFVEYSRSF